MKTLGNLLKKALEIAIISPIIISSLSCPQVNIKKLNFKPTGLLAAYQKEGSDKDNPAMVIDFDGKDLNGKSDIVEYKVFIKDKEGQTLQTLSEAIPIKQTIFIDEGIYYISGLCTDSQGATDDDGPVEVKISKLNYSPVATFNINPRSGNSPLESSLNLTGTDENGDEDITEYKIEIDRDKDGNIDETLTDSSPIMITRQFTSNTNIYGTCTDSKGAIGNVGPIEIVVTQPPVEPDPIVPDPIIPDPIEPDPVIPDPVEPDPIIPPVIINPPITSFSVGNSVGNIPLETLVSISGTKTDNEIVKYQIGLDKNEDGNLTPDEFIIDSPNPIYNKKIILTRSGTKKFYGICIDSEGNKGINGPVNVEVNPSNQPTDLTREINFTNTPYSIGDKLTFTAQLTNNTTPLNSLIVDNSNRQSLEYTLLKEIIDEVYEEVLKHPFDTEVTMTFNPPSKRVNRGGLKFEQKNDDNLAVTITNANVIYKGILLTIGDTPKTLTEKVNCYTFKQDGNFLIQTNIKYFVGEETSSRSIVLSSDNFSVSK